MKEIHSREEPSKESQKEDQDQDQEKWWEWMSWMSRWIKRMAKGGEILRMKIAWNYIGETIQFTYDNLPVEICLNAPIIQLQGGGGLRIQVIPIVVEPTIDSGRIRCFWNDTHWMYLIQKTEDSSGGFQIKGGERVAEPVEPCSQVYLENPLIQIEWLRGVSK